MGIGSIALSLFRTGVTASLDAIASTAISKAPIATLEDKTRSKDELAIQCLDDEGAETFWKAAFGSVLTKLSRVYTPFIPEQFMNIPGDLLGSFVHWYTATHQSLGSSIFGMADHSPTFVKKFFNYCIKKPIDVIAGLMGLDREGKSINTTRFALCNAGLFGLGTLALIGAKGENLPGINMEKGDPKNVRNIILYNIVEQCTHVFSQTVRYYLNYNKKEGLGGFQNPDETKRRKFWFWDNDVLGKALACVIHEKTFPGNFLAGIMSCFFTIWLPLPKSAAAAAGEIIPKAFTRLIEVPLRRSTSTILDEAGNEVPNHRLADIPWLYKIVNGINWALAPIKYAIIDYIVAPLFKPKDTDINAYRIELRDSLKLGKADLERKTKEARERKEIKNSGEYKRDGIIYDSDTGEPFAKIINPAPAVP